MKIIKIIVPIFKLVLIIRFPNPTKRLNKSHATLNEIDISIYPFLTNIIFNNKS